ncbi:MAG: hypothetical protein FD124_769 [Alphaproteobacteria bacterium]|nr:MAG: hypothetical protein FD124_769 [Alphaproteobacteria bacterium]
MADVFISYASEDRDRVRPLAEALIGRGLNVWWDRALVAGDDYARVIERELAAAKAVIVVWTQSAADSAFVRDEAGRARDQGRLVPVMLDRGVQIPLGFGAIHAEDLTAWNGDASAPQVSLVEEAVRARVEGRSVDGAAVQAKRRKLTARIRVMSILAAVAMVLVIAASVYVLSGQNAVREAAPVTRQDQLAQLLDLVAKGQITGDQALELARLLQDDAFKDVAAETAEAEAASSGRPLVADAPRVTRPDAVAAARASFSDAAATLLQDPDARVRAAVLKVGQPATRKAGLEEMWTIAREGGASAAPIWRACGALMLATGDDRAALALENARALNPQDKALWRMLSFAYAKQDRPREAAGAAFVGAGLDAASSSDWTSASARLERALPLMPDAQTRSFVLGQLGDVAAASEDWPAAEARYRAALGVHGDQKNIAGISMDASKLDRAQIKQGEDGRACTTLRRARQQGATVTQEELRAACADITTTRRQGAVTPPG